MTENTYMGTPGDVERVMGPFISLKGVEPTVGQVAEAVLYLVSDDSAFVTGHNYLVVDGGLVCVPFVESSRKIIIG
ncbi:hypothetical protein CASFOL_015590 [Castilleja foliolosa]|uniref:Uncharacterized protein n=1 Tax=Castilleja foliolosa TaxID=1961234 RepID=A0ABD3DI07_9LAMI